MALTPLLLMSGQGLLSNTGLDINQQMQDLLAEYIAFPFIADFRSMATTLQANVYDEFTNPDGMPQSQIDAIIHIMDNTMPVLTDVNPLSAGISTTLFSTYVNNHANNITGNGNNGTFIAILQRVTGHVAQMNEFVNSATNGASASAQTFTSMDSLMSGNITSVNLYTEAFGNDLIASGRLYDFSNLQKFGSPQSLIEKLAETDMLSSIEPFLAVQGIDINVMQSAIANNPDTLMKPLGQKRAYDAFKTVIGTILQDILYVLRIETPGITTLADLLDLRIMLPNSYPTLTTMNQGTLEHIYQGTETSEYALGLRTELSLSTPPDIAKANFAMSIALQQIKNIHLTTPDVLGKQAVELETNQGLEDISSQTEALPADVTTFYQTTLGGGTAINGTFYVTDAVGTAAGVPHTETFTTINEIVGEFISSNQLTDMEDILEVVTDVATGVYDVAGPPPVFPATSSPITVEIPPGTIGEGIYNSREEAIDALEVELNAAIAVLTANNPTEVAAANAAYSESIDHIYLELQTLQAAGVLFENTYTTFDAGVDFGATTGSQSSTLAFAGNLHSAGKRTTKGDTAEILEKMATPTREGEAIIAAMREGRNLQKLTEAGISADSEVSPEPEEILPGDIESSTYT